MSAERRSESAYTHHGHREEDTDRILAFIDQVGVGALVTFVDGEFSCTNLPVTIALDGDKVLLEAHIPRINPQSRHGGSPVMLIFQGPESYVQPGWCATEQRDSRAAPVWNYITARVHGHLEILDDKSFVLAHVGRLASRNEAGKPDPWSPSDSPAGYVDALLRVLVGIRITVGRFDAVWKVSGNQPEENQAAMIADIRRSGGDDALALGEVTERRGISTPR